MKKIILSAITLAMLAGFTTASAQKNKSEKSDNNNDKSNREIIIMQNGDKDTKLTIETKNGETLINGKPVSEYKDDNVTVITNKSKSGKSFGYAYSLPKGNMKIFRGEDWGGEKKAFLGVTTEKADNGVKITDVEDGSAAEKAGLKEGDIITKVGDKKISDAEDLTDAITSHKPKDEVKILYERNGKSNDAKVTLGESNFFKSFSFNGDNIKWNSDNMKLNENLLKNYNKQFNYTMPPMAFSQNGVTGLWRMGNHRLGVRIEDADNDGGATVTEVEDESNAAKAGLKKDDVITEVNGKKVKNVSEVLKEVRDNTDKSSYTIKAKRNGSEMNFEIKIPKKKNNADL